MGTEDDLSEDVIRQMAEDDPTHLRALADRVRMIAGLLEAVQHSAERRDLMIGRIDSEVQKIRGEVDRIVGEASAQFTPEQRKVLQDFVSGTEHRTWLAARVKLFGLYFSGIVGFLATAWTFYLGVEHYFRGGVAP